VKLVELLACIIMAPVALFIVYVFVSFTAAGIWCLMLTVGDLFKRRVR